MEQSEYACSVKFLVKMKNVSHFYLKTKGTFWPTQYSMVTTVSKEEYSIESC